VRQLRFRRNGRALSDKLDRRAIGTRRVYESEPQNDVGATCDVLNGFGKRKEFSPPSALLPRDDRL
jgi:hypothetical protein